MPGAPALDAPIEREGRTAWLLETIREGFTILRFGDAKTGPLFSPSENRNVRVVTIGSDGDARDSEGLVAARYDAKPGSVYLFRPDQHLAARWRSFDANAIERAIRRATAAR
jgi:3-(3-hydroxy-phenyl)propionate hydroxylase